LDGYPTESISSNSVRVKRRLRSCSDPVSFDGRLGPAREDDLMGVISIVCRYFRDNNIRQADRDRLFMNPITNATAYGWVHVESVSYIVHERGMAH
jgi:hypothetical protein